MRVAFVIPLVAFHSPRVVDQYRRMTHGLGGFAFDVIDEESFIRRCKANLNPSAVADAIIIEQCVDSVAIALSGLRAGLLGQKIAVQIRALPTTSTMADGRRWNKIPIVFLNGSPNDLPLFGLEAADSDVHCVSGLGEPSAGEFRSKVLGVLSRVISDYRQRLLGEYEDLGFLIREDHGRFRLGPALFPRKLFESSLYSGKTDKRDPSRWITVDRDFLGISYEAELFEALINSAGVSEPELQSFFEQAL